MAGTLIRVLSKTTYDMGTVLGSAASPGPFIIARNVDVSQWREGAVLVRLHSASWSGGASFDVLAYPSGPTEEDPGTDYLTSTPVATVNFKQGVAADSAPRLKTDDLGANFGGFLTLAVDVTQGASQNVTLAFTISVELSLKD